ncbi:MAG: CPBP family intramembrane metalloprotease [Chlamydiales bacterium]|nr:CPBP family intramembrane metalloprotease [Chlamydiales bacterium]
MKYALLFGLSALMTIIYCLYGQVYIPFVAFGLALMWLPGILALIFAKREGIKINCLAKPSWRFLTVAWRAILVVFLITLASLPFAQYAGYEQIRYTLPAFLQNLTPWLFVPLSSLYFAVVAVLAGLSVNMLAAMGEELMWRGYLWEKFKHLGFLKASILIGLLWGAWHAPLVVLFGLNYPEMPYLGVVMMIFFCMALSPILCFYRLKGLPVIYPAIFHGTLNAMAGASILIFNEPNLFWVSIPGAVGIIVLALFSSFDTMRAKKLATACVSE